jgi:hypothetical protein
MAKG